MKNFVGDLAGSFRGSKSTPDIEDQGNKGQMALPPDPAHQST